MQPELEGISLQREDKLNLSVFHSRDQFVLSPVYFPNECVRPHRFFHQSDESVGLFLGQHYFASFKLFTTSNSFPRWSITFTATCPCSPATNGALIVPARWSQTVSS